MNEPIEATAIAIREEPQPQNLALFGSDDPEIALEKAVRIANVLKKLIVAQGYAKKLGRGDREFVEVAGWQALGGFLDTFAQVEWSKEIEDGYEARVLLMRRGQIVGAGEAICTRSERNWKDRDPFALKSMAMTRAAGKAFRLTFGWLMTIAGYESCPQEEMVADAKPLYGASEAERTAPRKMAENKRISEAMDKIADDDTAANRERGIKAVHAYAREHNIDLDSPDSPYRKILLTDPAFAHHFTEPDVEVSSKALTYDELRRFYSALKDYVKGTE
jgi:hypothetical protein